MTPYNAMTRQEQEEYLEELATSDILGVDPVDYDELGRWIVEEGE